MADNNPYMSFALEDKISGAVPPTPAANDNPYMGIAQQELDESKQRIRGVLDIVSPVNPDEAAETIKLQRTTGLPQDTIRDNLIEVRRRERLRMIDAQKIMTDSPVLARQLNDPNFAKIAHDEVGPMGNLEMATSFITRSLGAGVLTLGGLGTRLTHEVLSWGGFTTPEEDIATLFKNDPAQMREVMDSPATALLRWSKAQQKMANDLMSGAPEAVKAKYAGLEYFTSDSDNAAYLSPVKMIGDAFQSLPTTGALMLSMYVTKGRAAGTYADLVAAGATREVAAKEAARVAADTMARVSAITEGLAGYGTQANQTRVDVDKIKQAQLEASPKYQELINDGYSPEAARVYLSAITADRAGSIAGVVDAITNFYGGKVLGRVIGEGGALLPRVGKGFATEALTEAPQSIGEQFGQNLAVRQLMNPDQSLTEGLGEAGAAGFFVGGLTGGAFTAVLGRAQQAQNEASKANVMFDLLGRLNDLSAANKVRERDVQSFETFMQSVEQDAGGSVNTLYIEPQTLVETLQATGVNIAEAKATLPSLANLDEQLRTGTMVSIPVSEFAARMAGSDFAQAILPQLKTDPNGMSKVEADEYMQTQGEQLKAEVEKVLGAAQQDNAFKASMEKVKANVKAQLDETQRFTKDVTDSYATLMSTFYSVMGARLGVTPEQMANQYPIKITAQSVTGGTQYDQAGNLKTDTPQFKNWFKQSKVVDKANKPMVMYHSTYSDVSTPRTNYGNDEFRRLGIHVGTLDAAQNRLSVKQNEDAANNERSGNAGANVMPVYIKAENSLRLDENRTGRWGVDDIMQAIMAKAERGEVSGISQEDVDAYMSDAFDIEAWLGTKPEPGDADYNPDQNERFWSDHGEFTPGERSDLLKAFIQQLGFDSIVYANEFEGGGDSYILLDPTQLKSAIGNNGEFDPNNPNILFQDNEQVQLNASEDAKEDAKSDDVAEINQADVPESVDAASILDNALKIAKSQVWAKGRDLKLAIQQAVQEAAQAAGVDVGAPSPQTTEYLVRAGVKDALLALQQNANAIGWYDIKTRQALSVMALVHPEIAKDQNARFAFVWALAVTSNGMKVGKNFELAEAAYRSYKKNGRMPTDIKAGQAQKAINESLAMFNELVDQWGIDDLRRFMLTNFTVGEIAAISKDLKPGGEHAATFVKGASILGPKIGNGFFSNLYGNFDQLTMDRWLVRTWGRWTGTLIKPMPHQTALARERLGKARDAVAGDAVLAGIIGTEITKDTPVDELALKVQEASTDPALREQMNQTEAGLELRKAGNSLAKYLDGQKEAPAGPNERNYIRQVFSEMLAELQLQPQYKDLTMADLQAVLWYAEKRLYETAKEENDEDSATEGYNDEDAPDYANAAADVARANDVSDRKIQNALKKEEQNGRTGNARSTDGQETQAGGEQGQAAGFTRGQKRLFIGTQAVHRARSNRAGGEGQSFAYARKSSGDGGEAGLLKPRSKKALGVTFIAEWKAGRGLGTIFRANEISTPTFYELAPGDEKNAQRFADLITESKEASGAVGAAVYVYPAQDYQGMRLFLAEDGKSGVAVKPDGDIVSVFSNSGAGRSVLELAVAAGGTKLDAFDTILPQFYAAHGFKAVSRLGWDDSQAPDGWDKQAMADFNGGEPDVVFMVLDKTFMGGYSRKDGRALTDYGKAVDTQTRAQRKLAPVNATYSQGEEGPRGKIAFGQDITQQASVITLLNAANLSTFLHESGHFFLEVTADIARRDDAPQQIRDDMKTVLKWFGVPSLATWTHMSVEEKRPYHEQFARGFEAYLFEGKSPNMELTGIFQRFRAWMVSIYKQLTSLNVTLDDEIRGVFDRMVASTDSIQQAEQARSYVPLFTNKPPFMSDEEWMAYQQSDLEATQDAVSDLERRSLRDMQWLTNAKARILKQLQKDAAEKRKDVRREVEAEVMAEPVYRAREFLKRGTIDGEKVEGGYKLSLPEIEEMYGDNPIVGSIKSALGFGKYGMLGTENGVHPTQVAELFGFQSGDHLVRSLLDAKDPREVIEQRTDARMLERYGDINSPEALSKAADEAIHNDARAKFVATEANALAKATGRPKVLASAAKQYASELIARLRIRDIRPGQYAASAARAAKNAAKPGVDLVEAATEKRNQLINTYAAKEAFNAQDEVIKAVRYLRKFDSKNIYKVVHPDYLDQIFALLDRFDLRSSTTLKDIDKRKALIEWVQAEQAKGNEPVVPQKLLDEAFRMSYKDMTLEDFRGLVDTVRNIEHLGRLKDKLLKIQDQREFKAVVTEGAESIREYAYKDVPQQLERRGIKDAVVKGGREILAWHRKFASIVREMDGFKDGGALWRIFVRPMNESSTKEASMREDATVKLGALYEGMGKIKLGKQEYIAEIGTSLSLEARLAIALNLGNETNMRRVMEGEGWNAGQVNAIVRSLTREQWNFVQGTWDLINSYWPEIAAKERRMTGLVPAKVEARPFVVTLADGTQMNLAGGYYPIKYNAERSSRAQADTAADVLKQMERGLYARAQTARGHLEARVESVGRPMRYDLGVIEQHLNQVIHDLSWHEYLVDANRLLRADPIDAAIRDHYGPEVLNVMRKTMEDIAIGELPAMNAMEKSVRWVRTGSSIAAMGWSIITAAQQPTGLAQSIKRIGPKWVAMGASRWLRDASSFENTAAWVNGKSEFMRLRAKTQMREVNEIRNQVEKGGAMSAVTGSFFYLTAKLQMVADMPTWLGMYEKAMAEGADEPKAIALADQAVLDSQGGGQIKDLSGAQKGNEFQKLWTNFYSYFNVTYNLLAESINETRSVGASRLPLLAVDVLLLTVVPATLGFLIKGALKGFGDGNDEDLAKKLVAENINYLLGTMIGLREIGAAASGSMGYEGPAGARFFADVGKFFKQVNQGDADEAFWRSANELGGVLLHYPASQIDRTVRGFQALQDGTTDNPLAILAGPPPKH